MSKQFKIKREGDSLVINGNPREAIKYLKEIGESVKVMPDMLKGVCKRFGFTGNAEQVNGQIDCVCDVITTESMGDYIKLAHAAA